MKITVTAEHIAKGQKQHPARCPIALAIRTALCPSYVSVGSAEVEIWRGENDERLHRQVPPDVDAFISAFDAGLPVSPFTFDLPLPEGTP